MLQDGARHWYQIPSILNSHGILEAMYTDLAGNIGLGKLAVTFSKFLASSRMRTKANSLANRELPGALVSKTKTSLIATALREYRLSKSKSELETFLAYEKYSERLGCGILEHDLRQATHLFTTLDLGAGALTRARATGVKVVSDVIIALSTSQIVKRERALFPGWETEERSDELQRLHERKARMVVDNSDILLCPSSFVQDDLVSNWGAAKDRTRFLPYPISAEWFELTNNPVQGRVLFAGSAIVRKGIQYFAQSARLLNERGGRFEFLVAGNVSDEITRREECKHLTFLGRIPRSEMKKLFETADLLVLPTLAEGSATVTYEAMASAVPVVTTRSAGAQIKNGVDGIIVPERDVRALADAIDSVVANRQLRTRLAKRARVQAAEFTTGSYAAKLIEILT